MSDKKKMVRCYVCTGKEYPENFIKEEKRMGKKNIYKYFHESCKKGRNVERKNKSNMFNWESNEHRRSKINLFKLISENKVSLIDQFNETIKLEYDFIGVESPIAIGHDIKIPYINLGNCKPCIDKYKLNNDFKISKIDEFKKELHIDEIKTCEDKDYFQIHPCVYCPFNNLKYKCIFDVGLGINGKYNCGIEVLHTSKIKRDKLLYCIQNDIRLIEITSSDVKKFKNNQVKCEKVWWKENDKIKVSERYEKVLLEMNK